MILFPWKPQRRKDMALQFAPRSADAAALLDRRRALSRLRLQARNRARRATLDVARISERDGSSSPSAIFAIWWMVCCAKRSTELRALCRSAHEAYARQRVHDLAVEQGLPE